MASKEAVQQKVIEIIAEQLGREVTDISVDNDLSNDLGADSLDAAELMIAFEEEFDIDIEEESQQNLTTVGDVINQIVKQLGE